MSVESPPAWTSELPSQWTQGCDAEVLRIARAAYDSSGRFYHTWDHILACFARLLEIRPGAPRASFLTLLFHDAIYVPGRGDNEQRSADLASEVLRAHSTVSSTEIEDVGRAILATAHHAVAGMSLPPDLQAALDADVSILGASWEEYWRYAEGVKQEFCPAVTDDRGFRIGRIHFLRAALKSKHLYLTEEGRRRWESAARANIARELFELRSRQTLFERGLAAVYEVFSRQ